MLHRVVIVISLFVSILVGAPRVALAAPDPDASLIALGQNLKLEVIETGPDQLWTLHLSNAGDFPIGVVADPGLLWFEVEVPGRSAPRTCRLPEPLWPKTMRRRAQTVLQPGERFSRRFDPRFFCFDDLMQTLLVPGARVSPYFGWPLETRMTRVGGKRTRQPLPPTAPFVAWAIASPPEAELPGGADAGTEPTRDSDQAPKLPEPLAAPPSEGVKRVRGATFVLSPAYADWTGPADELPPGLHTLMLAGSDAEDERNATVTVGVVNTSNTKQQVFVRRELFSYEVSGPNGTFQCAAGDLGIPDAASFTTLRPRRSERLVVRLVEMCPRGSFSRPGLYEVHGTLEAKHSGQNAGLDAFVGTLEAPRPALVRVRSGDRTSFLRATPMHLGTISGQPAPAAGEGPPGANPLELDGTPDGAREPASPDEPPPDIENVPMLDDGPTLEPPSDTLVE